METLYDCVVVANGSFPQTAGPLELLKATPVIIACDGACRTFMKGDWSRRPLSATWTVFLRKCSGYMPTVSIPWKIRR